MAAPERDRGRGRRGWAAARSGAVPPTWGRWAATGENSKYPVLNDANIYLQMNVCLCECGVCGVCMPMCPDLDTYRVVGQCRHAWPRGFSGSGKEAEDAEQLVNLRVAGQHGATVCVSGTRASGTV